jgi:glycosyltransferase involved in cell wall biosynthesis
MDMQVRNLEELFIVANDTDFLRRIGIPANEGEGFFKEIAPRKWFIPNCIDDSYFCPDPSIEKEKTIIVPRNIRPDRGIDLAIRAFSIFSKQFPDYQLKIIGGPLKGRYFNFCERLVAELGMQRKVIFAGSCDWKSMRDHYRKATLTMVPTLEKEGTSLSALESMACGTPVVGTNVAGLKDLPIVKAEPNPENLAENFIETLLHIDQVRIRQLTAVKTTFNLANWEKAWLRVVKEVYNNKRP